MKKLTRFSLFALVLTIAFSFDAQAQKFSDLDKSPMDLAAYPARAAEKTVKVYYSRPQLKGRDLSTLAPNGKVWRTGANESTEITFYKDVNFGGQQVKAGTYSLFTIPGEKEWTVILNSAINGWGSYAYKEANDVARVNVPVNNGEAVEAFAIAFDDNGSMHMAWGNVRVAVSIE